MFEILENGLVGLSGRLLATSTEHLPERSLGAGIIAG